MAQQTAVEYIISQLRQLAFNENTHLGMGDVRVTQGLIDELEERAKQIEKDELRKATIYGNQYQKIDNTSKKKPVYKIRKVEYFIIQIITEKGFFYRLWFLLSSPIIWLFKGEVKIK